MRYVLVFLLVFTSKGTEANEDIIGSDSELKCLALNVYHEARNQSIDGQKAVAFVTLNRTKAKRWPDTICGVVWQKHQFSWTSDGKPDNPYNPEAWRKAQIVALTVATSPGLRDNTQGATHYHATYVSPRWGFKQVAKIGDHIFYR